jgi:RNA polymerase sigma-70 factor, ECF subfamily
MIGTTRALGGQREVSALPGSHGEIYRDYNARVRRICLSFFYDPMEAEDLCHEVFINVFRHWMSFRGESHPMRWISCIARNICLSHLRKKKSRASSSLLFIRESETPAEFGVEQLYEARLLLAKTISSANPVNRSILHWYYHEGWSHSEIAVKLGVSRVAITRALTRVRKKWAARAPGDCRRIAGERG